MYVLYNKQYKYTIYGDFDYEKIVVNNFLLDRFFIKGYCIIQRNFIFLPVMIRSSRSHPQSQRVIGWWKII